MEYQLEIKQIVDFPRCRIYRDFVRSLIANKSIRTNGGSFFFFITLFSVHMQITVHPIGAWSTSLTRLVPVNGSVRLLTFVHGSAAASSIALSILNHLKDQNCITFTLLEKNKVVKFKITDWPKDNTVLEYNCPCKKDEGLFFFPIARVHEFISMGKCSEMDILLDLWIHAVYNDPSVQGSYSAPVVYYRNNSGNPLTSFQTLGDRWNHSKATISRILKNLKNKTLSLWYRSKAGMEV